jgi:hypothetical protein
MNNVVVVTTWIYAIIGHCEALCNLLVDLPPALVVIARNSLSRFYGKAISFNQSCSRSTALRLPRRKYTPKICSFLCASQ